LVAAIDTGRHHGNLSSAIRLFVLDHFQAHPDSHREGGNGDGDHRDGPKTHRRMVAMGAVAEPSGLPAE
jgi:predicted DNA-binding ribbon-helix-helix protein